MLYSYHNHVEWFHQTEGELRHQRSRTSDIPLQKQVPNSFRETSIIPRVHVLGILTLSWWDVLDA